MKEVVDGEERVDAGDSAKVQSDYEVPEILTRDHAVGVLANQDEVWLEGPTGRQKGSKDTVISVYSEVQCTLEVFEKNRQP
ncbi:hypothetical protein INR49_003922 [Caranx melampygus]|nr:hypothetical protein INR49_003922 [Caranx melampygus]